MRTGNAIILVYGVTVALFGSCGVCLGVALRYGYRVCPVTGCLSGRMWDSALIAGVLVLVLGLSLCAVAIEEELSGK
jgi:hypothetical protein